jgi:hypothetical protein
MKMNTGYPLEWFLDTEDNIEHLICSLCLTVLNDPHCCENEHQFCKDCILKSIRSYKDKCPICTDPLTKDTIRVSRFAQKIIEKLKVRCFNRTLSNKCVWTGNFSDRFSHNCCSSETFLGGVGLRPEDQKQPLSLQQFSNDADVSLQSSRRSTRNGRDFLAKRASLVVRNSVKDTTSLKKSRKDTHQKISGSKTCETSTQLKQSASSFFSSSSSSSSHTNTINAFIPHIVSNSYTSHDIHVHFHHDPSSSSSNSHALSIVQIHPPTDVLVDEQSLASKGTNSFLRYLFFEVYICNTRCEACTPY